MKRNLWLFLLKLLPATLILGWLWFAHAQHAYPYWIDPVATFFFKLFGVRVWHLALTAEHFTNLVPYLALLLATPGLVRNWKRTLTALFVGLAVIVLVHIFMSVAIYYIVEAYSMSKSAYRIIVPIYLVNDAMPLILWLAFFPKVLSDLFGFIKWGKGGGEAVKAS
ncbi:MAG: hypothetical protein KAW46_10165 [candidate division Zixibacteria bacterium]|nr:hypothetical protein [candidate division Zixibacteria bacterium]